jgi:tetratricopeptide (TPR) repeat protein
MKIVGRTAAPLLAVLALVGASTAQPAATDELIKFHQARVARDPDDHLGYNRLGAVYIRKARESGDVAYYGLADQAFRKSLALVGQGAAAAPATTSLAVVELARHRFTEAARLAADASRLAPDDPGARAILGDAHVEVGEYDKADAAYSGLSLVAVPALTYPRLAHMRFLRGDLDGAIAHMHAAIDATAKPGGSPEPSAWARAELGELLFHKGDLRGAATRFADALTAFPRYHRGHAGLAKVRAAQGRYADAAELYRKALDVVPLPEYAAALGDVYVKLGRPADARLQYDLVEYVARLGSGRETLYNRELALFYADHDVKLDEALTLARRELDVRRDVYTWDVLAWALLKTQQPHEAQRAMTEALRLGTRDARLFFHAAVIAERVGDAEAARAHVEKARALNPRFSVLYADEAERLARRLGAGRR